MTEHKKKRSAADTDKIVAAILATKSVESNGTADTYVGMYFELLEKIKKRGVA
jgi:hypothetical protein